MTELSINVDPLQLPARHLVRQTADIYRRHLGHNLVTLVAHGSAVKGGFIPRSSDVDLVAFLRPGALTPHSELPIDVAIRMHRDLSQINPTPFRYIQGVVLPCDKQGPIRFIPETYCVVLGDPVVPTATTDELMHAAWTALRAFEPERLSAQISNALLDQGEGRLSNQVRSLCTKVWPVMYHVACIHHGCALDVWQRTKFDVAELLSDEPAVGSSLNRWMDAVMRHYGSEESSTTALDAIHAGVSFLGAASRWFHQLPGDSNTDCLR